MLIRLKKAKQNSKKLPRPLKFSPTKKNDVPMINLVQLPLNKVDQQDKDHLAALVLGDRLADSADSRVDNTAHLLTPIQPTAAGEISADLMILFKFFSNSSVVHLRLVHDNEDLHIQCASILMKQFTEQIKN